MGLGRRLLRLVVLVGLAVALALGGLVAVQDRFVFPARRYAADQVIPPGVVPVEFSTDQGAQTAWLDAPSTPTTWWIACGGNGMTALGWQALVRQAVGPEAGILLIDYPGYGRNPGSASPERCRHQVEAAVAAVERRLGHPIDTAQLHLVGHSLGAAVVLSYAAAHPVRTVVLSAPFTSLMDMGHRVLGWTLGHLTWHRFDNRHQLERLSQQPTPPRVVIQHGDADALIPVAMAQELAAAHPTMITLRIITGADHHTVLAALPHTLSPAPK